jgi:hypothetical protein
MMPYNEFEEGDIVECVRASPSSVYVGAVGERFKVIASRGSAIDLEDRDGVCWIGSDPARFKLYKKKGDLVEYEDKWHLNDGSVEIPEDAEKLMNPEGTSVVAYRLVKKPEVKTFIRFVCPQPRGYMIESYKYPDTIAKLTFITTDGELTDIQWEKI